MSGEEEISLAIQQLIRAATIHNFKKQLKWHKTLYQIGKPAISKISSTVKSYHSSNLDLRTKHICISALMRLIHDMDESEAQILTDEIIKSGCETLISTHLKSINEFTLKNFDQYQIKGVTIFEERKISPSYSIRLILEKWFGNVPTEDLKEVDRIYIVSRKKQDYAGNYMPIFFSINVVWYGPSSRYHPLFWISVLFNEHTLYHEIGHHFHRHALGWKDPHKEKQANRYASKIMAKSHPVLVSVLVPIVRILKKASIRKAVKKIQEDAIT